MSFLNVKIPVVTIDSLIDDIRKQVEVGRLLGDISSAEVIENPTPEVDRLIDILQTEFKERHLSPILTLIHGKDDFDFDEHFESDKFVCYIFCIKKNQAGGAFWTDLVRRYELDENTFLKCREGSLQAETGKGGTYLLLVRQ